MCIDADLVDKSPLLWAEDDFVDFIDRYLVEVDHELTKRALLSRPAKLLDAIDDSLALRLSEYFGHWR